ncbi:MAG: hypothetical protein Q4B50_02140 [Bacillota bacterium]|nr:hypothetical protein [Bacillota bacterium]
MKQLWQKIRGDKLYLTSFILLLLAWLLGCLRVAIVGWGFLFLGLLFLLAAYVLLAIPLLICLILLIRRKSPKALKGFLLAAAIVFLLPWARCYEEARFQLLRLPMQIAAEQIIREQGSASFYGEEVQLPPHFFLLSRGGRVKYYAQDDVVLFYTNPGIIDNYAGYLYFPEEKQLPDDSPELRDGYYDGLIRCKEKGRHWVYGSWS